MYRENHRTSLHKRAKPLADRRSGKGIRHAAIATGSICDRTV
jgi:hypothetical protein